MTMSSFNKFNNNVGRDTLIVCIGNCMTSFFAGFVIFSVIGSMAHTLNVPVASLADAGPGLAFIAYPQALALMPVPQLWSILFFLMMICLGLDSQYAMVEVVVTGLTDEFPQLRSKKQWILGAVCLSGFLLGLLFTSPGGMYWFVMFEDYSAAVGFIIVALTMLIAIYWLYGNFCTYFHRFYGNVVDMVGYPTSCFRIGMDWYYKIMWWAVTPAMLVFIIIFSFIQYANPTAKYGYKEGIYVYETTGVVISILLNFTPLVILVVFAGLAVVQRGGFMQALKPSEKWRPQGKPKSGKTYEAENVAYSDEEDYGGL